MPLKDYQRIAPLPRPLHGAVEVWRALDHAGHPVLLKILKSSNAAERSRFLDESRCAPSVVSPHVAQVWEAGVRPEPYLVFEHVEGRDLGQVAPLRRPWEYLRTAAALVSGVVTIHDAGISHRDLTPAAVRYEGPGLVKIVDLGVAFTAGEDRRIAEALGPAGTDGWMAPERAGGRPLSLAEEQRADIFSVGLLLAYLRTGRHPFDGDQVKIRDPVREPALSGVEGSLHDILRRTLDRNPERRPDARDLLRAIRKLERQAPPPVRAGARRGSSRLRPARPARAAVALTVVAGLAVVLATVLTPRGEPALPQTGCAIGDHAPNPGDAVLRIGVMLPQSGPLASQGTQQFTAAELALSDVRSAGGVHGIQIDRLDDRRRVDEGDPFSDTACASVEALLDQGTDVIIGPSSSAVSQKIIDKVISAGTILFSPANTAPEFTDYADRGLYFRTAPSDALQGRVLGRLVSDDGNDSAVIIARNDLYGRGLSREVRRSLQEANVEVLAAETYLAAPSDSPVDHGGLAARVAGLEPDAVVLIGFDESARVIAELRDAGLSPQQVNVYGTDGNMRETLPVLVDPADAGVLEGMRGTTTAPLNPAFAERLNAFVGGGLVEFTYAAQVYDAVVVAALASAAARSDQPAAIAREINDVTEVGAKCTSYAACIEQVLAGVDIDYDGISGPLEFNDAGEPCVADYRVAEFDAAGRLVAQSTAETSSFCVRLR